ncbi:hypothetical protein B4U37_21625 (plasmid) [Sutcliffiella horikoshii]|uniref:ABC transporter permease n=1 Tax=Sutcliffiella horikoshii TaxID=79883 RepID=A0ABN4ZM84_9BACI|nr:ABC transporter permease [Sutcliffiella horikoshii]ART78714.1 hypothetical protein B4U37_21625 [Sutcliffiella horikoshii]
MNVTVKLIKNELKKIHKSPRNLIFYLMILAIVIGIGLMSKYIDSATSEENWKDQLENEIKETQEFIDDNPEMPIGVKEDQVKHINNLEYYLSSNTNPYEKNNWTFVMQALKFSSVISLFTIILASEIVSNEFAKGTIKTLLTKPFKRWKILLSKYCSMIIFMFSLYLCLIITSIIVGAFLFGIGDFNSSVIIATNTGYEQQLLIPNILKYFCLKSLDIIVICTITFMISTLFRSNTIALVLTLLLLFGSGFLTTWINNFSWGKYTLFPNMNLTQFMTYNFDNDNISMYFSLIAVILYSSLFLGITFYTFNKKDI